LLKSKIIILLSLLIVIPNAWADVSILNDKAFIADDGTFHIVGEIQNELELPINQIDVHATLYSEDGNEINSATTTTLVNRIMPNMKGPFDLMINGVPENFAGDYQLLINYKVSEPKSQVIDITSSELSRDNFGNLIITGTVENKGDITANTIIVVATFYDKNGNVAATTKIQTEPDYLKANDETFFLISLLDESHTKDVTYYTVVAESEEYAPVPEFSLGSLIVLTSSVSAYLILIRFTKRLAPNMISASNL